MLLIFGNGIAFAEPDDEIVAFEIETHTGKQQDRPETVVSPASSKQDKQQPTHNKPNCDKPKNAEEADLCEQGRMAQAAEDLLDRTDTQIRLIKWEIGGLIATVVFAAIAAIAAAGAVLISRRAVAIEQRAWLAVDLRFDGTFEWAMDGTLNFRATANIKNIGKTPALNILTTMEMVCDDIRGQQEAVSELAARRLVRDTQFSRMLVPGDNYDRKWGFGVHPDEMAQHNDDDHMFVSIIGCVTYETLYDRKLHQTTFVYGINEIDPDAPGGTEIIRVGVTRTGKLSGYVQSGGFAT